MNVETSREGAEMTTKERLEQIEQDVATLKARADQMRKEMETSVMEKVTDQETLRARSIELDVLQKSAQATLKSLSPLRELEGLKDNPEFIQYVTETVSLAKDLIVKQEKVNREIAGIVAYPGVMETIHEEANVANQSIDKKRKTEALLVEFQKDAEVFTDAVSAYTERYNGNFKKRAEIDTAVGEEVKKCEKVIDDALQMFDSKKGEVGVTLRAMRASILNRSDGVTIENLMENLAKVKKSLGLFKGKYKKAIDYVLSKKKSVFEPFQIALKAEKDWPKEITEIEAQRKQLEEMYHSLGKKFDSLDEGVRYRTVNDLAGKKSMTIPYQQFQTVVESFHNIHEVAYK
ncbi:MAG: hypothetical protein ABI430_04330 [Candidatus Taylorbacteria bacterium]